MNPQTLEVSLLGVGLALHLERHGQRSNDQDKQQKSRPLAPHSTAGMGPFCWHPTMLRITHTLFFLSWALQEQRRIPGAFSALPLKSLLAYEKRLPRRGCGVEWVGGWECRWWCGWLGWARSFALLAFVSFDQWRQQIYRFIRRSFVVDPPLAPAVWSGAAGGQAGKKAGGRKS